LSSECIDQIRTVGRRWEAIGARNPDLAPWRAHLAQALLLAGQREEARALADEHAALARTWGAHRPLARALRVQGLTADGNDGTALLRKSVQVAGDGHANRQIAQRLFITQKTVETHLAHAFRKLHIDSRAQIPAALSR
jgi:DNA-binding NarL/FixJ family response regulator